MSLHFLYDVWIHINTTENESFIDKGFGGNQGIYLIFIRPEGGDGKFSFEPAFTWKTTLETAWENKTHNRSDQVNEIRTMLWAELYQCMMLRSILGWPKDPCLPRNNTQGNMKND